MSPSLEWIVSLSSLHARVFKKIDRHLSAHGISFSEFYVMHCLSREAEQTMRRTDLADAVGMSVSGITRLLAPMEKLQLVQKEKNPRDARVSLVKLSDAGMRVYQEALPTMTNSADTLLKPLDGEAVRTFDALAKKIQ